MTAELRFRVVGEPGAQGSKTAFRTKTGKTVLTESSAKVKPWRQDVVAAAEDAAEAIDWQAPPQVRVVLVFGFRRPKHHYGTGRNAVVLKPSAPYWHGNKPDADKLARSTLDALTTSGVIGDDAQVVDLAVFKIWLNSDRPAGAYIVITAPRPRHWFERTGHCAGCGQPGNFCLCTDTKPCPCADLHQIGSGRQADTLAAFATSVIPPNQDALFGDLDRSHS